MKSTIIIFLTALVLSCQPKATEIFVSPDGDRLNAGTIKSPLGTIEQAQRMVREKMSDNPDQDIRVILMEGTYFLSKTLVFDELNGGNQNSSLTYEGMPGKEIVFSGGQKVSGWKELNGLWQLEVPDIESIEQLYVNGGRAVRARIPNLNDDPARWYMDSIKVVKDRQGKDFLQVDLWIREQYKLPDFSQSGDFEIVIFKDWATLRKQVAAYDPESGRLALRPPFALFDGNYNGLLAPYLNRFTGYLEGHPAFIDQPGEWAFDKKSKMLFYKPLPDQTPEACEVIVPYFSQLVQLTGSKERRVQNLHFKNIHFTHSAYQLPEFGHDGRQACFYYNQGTGIPLDEALIEEAIRVEWAENCSFENCWVEHTGANGIYVTTGSKNILIDQTILRDIGGNPLMIGMAKDPGLESEELVKGIRFSNGEVSRGGRHYDSAVGIWMGFCRDCQIVDNEVYDLPYTGISVGWQWNPKSTSSGANLIEGNHIYQVMQMLGDGGGIYTLGFQPGSVIRNNEIHDILRSELNHASPNNGMFIDEGSKGYLVEGNHIYRVSHTCIRGHRAAGVELRNNHFEPGEFPAVSHTPPYGKMIFANSDSTIVWPNPGWPVEWGYPDSITAFTMNGNQFK